jgi:hypothetical protein
MRSHAKHFIFDFLSQSKPEPPIVLERHLLKLGGAGAFARDFDTIQSSAPCAIKGFFNKDGGNACA